MVNQASNIHKNTSGWRRLPRATICSLKGYKAAWQFESGFRQYSVISLLLLPISFFISQSTLHWFLLVGSLVFLLFAEIVNSAIEAIADALTTEFNEFVGRGKDLGSAGVFSALLFALTVWINAIYEYASAYWRT